MEVNFLIGCEFENNFEWLDYGNIPSARGERKRQSYRNHSRKSSGVDESRIINIQDRV